MAASKLLRASAQLSWMEYSLPRLYGISADVGSRRAPCSNSSLAASKRPMIIRSRPRTLCASALRTSSCKRARQRLNRIADLALPVEAVPERVPGPRRLRTLFEIGAQRRFRLLELARADESLEAPDLDRIVDGNRNRDRLETGRGPRVAWIDRERLAESRRGIGGLVLRGQRRSQHVVGFGASVRKAMTFCALAIAWSGRPGRGRLALRRCRARRPAGLHWRRSVRGSFALRPRPRLFDPPGRAPAQADSALRRTPVPVRRRFAGARTAAGNVALAQQHASQHELGARILALGGQQLAQLFDRLGRSVCGLASYASARLYCALSSRGSRTAARSSSRTASAGSEAVSTAPRFW